MGRNHTKQTKLDFVDFLRITLSLDWSVQNETGQKPWYREPNMVDKNICNHDFNYGLVFLIFLI